MLQALREKTTGWFAVAILGFMGLLIALTGLQGYVVSSFETAVAKVGDKEIPPGDFSTQFSNYLSRMAQQGQDVATLTTPERKREMLESMVTRELLAQATIDAGLVPATSLIQNEIAQIPDFQVDGKFDEATYLRVLAGARLSENEFFQGRKEDRLVNAIPQLLSDSVLVPDSAIEDFIKLRDQTRDFRSFSLDVNDLPPAAQPTDAEIKAFYESNKASKFQTQEMADFEYIRIQKSTLPQKEVTEAMVKERYDSNPTRFKTPERRQAAHILIEVAGGSSAPPDAQKSASDKAVALAERARKGEDFAELAKANSQDAGSAGQGGDLGLLERGITQPAFETKLFTMQLNEISDPVLTDDGYHVIKLTAIEAERVKSFEEAQMDLRNELVTENSNRGFTDLTGKLYDLTLNDPNTLQSAAKALNLPIQRTGMIPRFGGSDPLTQNPKFLSEAFAPRIVRDQQNSGLINLVDDEDTIVLRVAKHQKAEAKALDVVRSELLLLLQQERQSAALKAKADSLMKEIQGGKTFADVAKAQSKEIEVSEGAGRNSVNRAPEITAEVFKAAPPLAGKGSYAMAIQGTDRISIIELTAVKDADPKAVDQASRDSIRQQLAAEISMREFKALESALKERISVEIFEDRLSEL